MTFDLFWQNLFVLIPTAVESSNLIAVGPRFYPISVRVVRKGTTVCALTKMAPYSALTADTMMLRMILHTTSKMTLTVGTKTSGFLGLGGTSLRNKPHWPGFWPERLKVMMKNNVWIIASH